MRKTKKFTHLILMLSLLISCGPKEKIEKIMEDDVEVIINHLEPYRVKERTVLNLEEEVVIDTEENRIASLGLTDIRHFDVDSRGNIYLLEFTPREGNNIFKFDSTGKFISSFGTKGEGPGEFLFPNHLEIDNQDNILVTDRGRRKLIVFDSEGSLIEETDLSRLNITTVRVSSLENGKFLIFGRLPESNRDAYLQAPLRLASPRLEEEKELDRYKLINPDTTNRWKGTEPLFCWSASEEAVFTGNEERGYEVWMFDLEGNLIRKIRKEYEKVPLTEKYKKEKMEKTPEMLSRIIIFPEFFPPYQSFFTDDKGRLFVMTYEEGENPGEHMTDIINPDGAFIGRKSLDIWVWEGLLKAKMRQDFLYCLQEKESGYKRLVGYKTRWEKPKE